MKHTEKIPSELFLSKLPNDTLLCVRHRYDGDIEVMCKEEFLNSAYFLDYPVEPFPLVTLAEKETKTFYKNDLYDMIERIGEDDTYEDWDHDVYDEIKDLPETSAFLERLNETSSNHPVYWEGRSVEIDMTPPKGETTWK